MAKKHEDEVDYNSISLPDHTDEVDYASLDIPSDVKKKDQSKPGPSLSPSGSEIHSTLKTNHEIAEESHAVPAQNTGATISSSLGTTTYSSGIQAPVQTSNTVGAVKPVKSFVGSEMKSKERDEMSRKLNQNLTKIQNDAIAANSDEQKGINEANQKRKEMLDAMKPEDRNIYLQHERSANDYNAKLTSTAESIQLKHYQDEEKQLKDKPEGIKTDSDRKRQSLVKGEISRLQGNIDKRDKINDEDPAQITQQFATGQMSGEDEGVKAYLDQQKIDNPGHYHDLVQKANSGKFTDEDKSRIVTNVKQTKSADVLRDIGISVARGYDKMPQGSPERQEYDNEISKYNTLSDQTKDLYKAYPALAKQELNKENLEKYLKANPKAGLAYNTLAAGYNGFADFAESLIGTGKELANAVEFPFKSESDYMKKSDEMMENVHDFIHNDVKLTTTEQKAFNKDGSVNVSGILPSIAGQVVNMAMLVEGGKELSAIGEVAGMAPETAEKLGTFATNMAMTYPEKVRSAMDDNGLSAKDARITALTTSTLESFIYSLNPLLGQGEAKAGVQDAVDLLIKGDKAAFAEKMTKLIFTNPAKVTAQMLAADATDKVSGYVANKVLKLKDGDKFNDEFTKGDLMNTVAMTMATTWLLGGMGHKSMKSERDGAVLELSKNIPKSVDYINGLAQDGKITEDQQVDLLRTLNASEKIQKAIPKNLDQDVKDKILSPMIEKHIIEEQNKGLDPIFQKENDKRIEDLDNQIKSELGIKPEENAVQEQSTESVLQREPGETGETGSERGRVEQVEQWKETPEAQVEGENEIIPKTKEDSEESVGLENYISSATNKQELAEDLVDKLRSVGFELSGNISESESQYGTSRYVIATDKNGNDYKFRISDHSVTNANRIGNEYHVKYDNIGQQIVKAEKKAFPERFNQTSEIYVSKRDLKSTDRIISEKDDGVYLVDRLGEKGIMRRKVSEAQVEDKEKINARTDVGTKEDYVNKMMESHFRDEDFEAGSPEAKLAQKHYENKFERLSDEVKTEKPIKAKKVEAKKEIEPHEIVLPGNEQTVHVIKRGKNNYQVTKTPSGDLKITDMDGYYLSRNQERKVKASYEAKMDFNHGERVPEDELNPEMNNNDIAQSVMEKSHSPAEVVEALQAVPKVLEHGSDSKDAVIANNLGKIRKSDFAHYSDANLIDKDKSRNYFHNGKGHAPQPLDVIAQGMSYEMNPEGNGDEIQPQDIVDFINNNPKGIDQFNKDLRNPLYAGLKDKFKRLTGLDLTPRLTEKVLRKTIDNEGFSADALNKINTKDGLTLQDYEKEYDEAISKGEIDPESGKTIGVPEGGKEASEEARPDTGDKKSLISENPNPRMVEAGASKRIREGREEVRKELKAKYDRDPIMYAELSNDSQWKAAEKLIERLGFDGVFKHVMEDRIPLDELPAALTAGRITETILFDKAIEAENAGNKELSDKYYEMSDSLGEKTAMYLVKAGRVGSAMSNFVTNTPKKQVRSLKKAIDRNNEPKVRKADVDYNKLDKKISEFKKTAAKKVAKRMAGGHESIEKAANAKVKKIREDRTKLFDKWKNIGKDGPVRQGFGMSDEQIKVGAEIVASYIQEGYVRLDELAKKMRADFKHNLNHDLTSDEIERILKEKQGSQSISELAKNKEAELIESFKSSDKGTAVEKDEKARKFTQAQFESEQRASERKKLSDTIKKHYEGEGTQGELKETLVNDHGYDEKTANELSASIERDVLKMAEADITSFLDRKLGVKKEVNGAKKAKTEEQNKAAKEFTDLVLSGGATKDKYKEAFRKKYGLLDHLTKGEEDHLIDLATKSRNAKGAIREQLAHEMVKFMSQKFPLKKIDAFWAMYYPSILSGPSTHIVNISTNVFHLANEIAVSAIKDIVKFPAELLTGKSVVPETIYKIAGLARGLADGSSLAWMMLKHGGGESKFLQAGHASGDDLGAQLFRSTDIENIKLSKWNPLRAWQEVYKYVPRFLSAADAMGYSGFRQMELTGQVRDRAINQGLRGDELRKTVMDDIWGTKKKTIDAQEQAEKEMEAVGMSKFLDNGSINPTYVRRTKEIISEKLNQANVEAAEKYARRMTFKDKPTGTMGVVANAVSWITRGRYNPLKTIAPFVNVPFNIANILIDNTPYGLLRANGMTVFNAMKYIGNKVSDGGTDLFLNKKGIGSTTHAAEEGHYFPSDFGREYTNQLTKGVLASAGLVYLQSVMSWDSDDKNGKVLITGDHAGFSKNEGYERDKVYPRNCMFIRKSDGKWGNPIPYGSINPYALSLAILGNASDLSHSKNHEMNEVLDYTTAAFGSTFKDLEDMLPLQGFANLADAVHDFNDPGKKDKMGNMLKSLEKTTLGVATMPLIPNFAKQVAKVNDPRLWQPETQGDIMWKVLGGTASDDNTTIDTFGEEVKRYPGEQFIPTSYYLREEDPVRRLMIDNNIFPTKVSDHMTYFDFTDPKSNSHSYDEQQEAIKEFGDDKVKLRQMQVNGGKLAHSFMVAHYDELSKITDRDILKKNITKIFNEQREHVKSAIERGLPMPTSYWPTKLLTEEQGEKAEEKSDLAKMRKLIHDSNKYK